MKNILGRASAATLAALVLVAAPEAAVAQKKKKDEAAAKFNFSKPVQTLVAQAQEKQKAGDHAGALELLKQADALPEKNQDDVYIINMLMLNSSIVLKDNALMEKSLEGAISSGKLTREDEIKFRRNVGALAMQRNDVVKAQAEYEKLIEMDPSDAQLMVEVAELQRRQKQNDKAIASMQQAIAVQEKSGQKADESWYRRTLAIAYDSKLPAQTASASEALVKSYPNPTNWRDVLVIYRDSAKFDDQGNLDVMRLMRANNALAGERDYAEYAETAALRGFPGEAKAVLDEGVAKGAIKPTAPFVKEIQASVGPKIAADKASLPGLEKESAAAKTGKAAMATGDAYLGYGNYTKAAELYKLALTKGSVDAATVNTRLGFALGKAGDKAGAEAAFAAVTTPPRAQLANYYRIWLNNPA